MMTIDQQVKLTVTISAILSAFVVMPLVYMAADNQPPYEYNVENSYVIPDPTPPGRQLVVHWELRKVNRICPGTITRSIVDVKTKERIVYDPTASATNVEVGDTYLNRTIALPAAITPGEKEYYADGEFHCNLLQRFWPLRVRTPRLRFYVSD